MKHCNFEPFCFLIKCTKNTYVKKGCNLLNFYLLTVLLSIPINKLHALVLPTRRDFSTLNQDDFTHSEIKRAEIHSMAMDVVTQYGSIAAKEDRHHLPYMGGPLYLLPSLNCFSNSALHTAQCAKYFMIYEGNVEFSSFMY